MCRRPLLNDKLREVSSFPQPLSGHVKSVRRRFEKILLVGSSKVKKVSQVSRHEIAVDCRTLEARPDARAPRPSPEHTTSTQRQTEDRGVLYSEPDSDTTPCVRTFTEIVNDDLASQTARVESMAMR